MQSMFSLVTLFFAAVVALLRPPGPYTSAFGTSPTESYCEAFYSCLSLLTQQFYRETSITEMETVTPPALASADQNAVAHVSICCYH